MLRKSISISALILIAVGLMSCSDTTQEQGETVSNNSTVAESPVPSFHTGITIREIMSSLVDPHADMLWNSVRVVSDSSGITEFSPETDEEWGALKISAISIIEGANSLMIPGRQVARPGAVGEFPEFEFTPEEVQELLDADPQSWIGYSQGLQNAALEMLKAVDERNSELLIETGAYLDEACEACHADYWYREGI